MAQYINKDILIKEIEKLVDKDIYSNEYDNGYHDGNNNVLCALKRKINTIEVKEMNLENLREELDKEWNKCEPIDEGMGLEITSIEHEQFDNIAKYFFNIGLKANKMYN